MSNEREQESKGVPNAGPKAIGDVCIPKEQQKLISAMLDNGFCVALAGSGNLRREPWHFELSSGITGWCTSEKTNPNLKKLPYFLDPTLDPG